MKPLTVRLSDSVRARIALLVGRRRLAEFARDAIENELRRRERKDPELGPEPPAKV